MKVFNTFFLLYFNKEKKRLFVVFIYIMKASAKSDLCRLLELSQQFRYKTKHKIKHSKSIIITNDSNNNNNTEYLVLLCVACVTHLTHTRIYMYVKTERRERFAHFVHQINILIFSLRLQ